MGRTRVLIVGVGGTIASIATSEGIAPRLGAEMILRKALRGRLPEGVEVEFLDLLRIDSSLMHPEDWIKIARVIYENYRSYDSFLILHGTDTMAYTAAALAFSLRGLNKPVVLTGSMRTLDEEGTDVPKNLWDSLVFSREAPKLGLSGVYVVFHGKVILGVRASKVNSIDPDAFASVNYPYVAYVRDEEVSVQHIPRRQIEEALRLEVGFETSIAVIKVFPGVREDLIEALISAGVRGLVVESYGLGGLPEELISKLSEISGRVPVLITSQPTYGGVNLKVYEVGRRLLDSNVIPACDMAKEAAVVKFMWVLSRESDIGKIREEMLRGYEDEVKPCL
mgnify:CR=1 FL=1